MSAPTLPRPPKHLSRSARDLYRKLVADYELESHHLAILVATLEARDRLVAARELVDTEGLVVTTRLGERKAHPAVAIERDARIAFLRGMRELGLDLADADAARPPRTAGQRR